MKEKIKKLELEAGMIMIYNSNIIPNDYNKVKELREWINPNKEIKFKLLFKKVEMVHMEMIFINIVIRKDQH